MKSTRNRECSIGSLCQYPGAQYPCAQYPGAQYTEYRMERIGNQPGEVTEIGLGAQADLR